MSARSTVLRISAAAAGALCLTARSAFAQATVRIDEAARNAIARLDLQTEIPGDPGQSWLDLDLPAIGFGYWIMWAAITIGIALALYAARDELPRLIFGHSKRWADDPGEAAAFDASASPAQAALAADDLASKGYYMEAMHVLLLRAIAEMRERLGISFAQSLTSREILRRAKLPEQGKTTLMDIITRVELSYFGAYPAGANDYHACRDSFERFMAMLGSRESPA
jgi:hypothetical protein